MLLRPRATQSVLWLGLGNDARNPSSTIGLDVPVKGFALFG